MATIKNIISRKGAKPAKFKIRNLCDLGDLARKIFYRSISCQFQAAVAEIEKRRVVHVRRRGMVR